MIEFIHKYPVLIKVLLAAVTLLFVASGGYVWSNKQTSDYAAKVDETIIGTDEYQKALYRMEDTYRSIYQGNMPEGLMEKLNLPKRTLDGLIDKKVLLIEAGKHGIDVSDSELSAAILEVQSFQGKDGKFSMERYNAVLKANNMTPAVFERAMKQDMIVEKFRGVIKDSVYVPDSEVLDYYKKQLAAQGKEFKQEEFETQKMNIFRMLTANAQEKTLRSMTEALRKNYTIVENPSLGIKG